MAPSTAVSSARHNAFSTRTTSEGVPVVAVKRSTSSGSSVPRMCAGTSTPCSSMTRRSSAATVESASVAKMAQTGPSKSSRIGPVSLTPSADVAAGPGGVLVSAVVDEVR